MGSDALPNGSNGWMEGKWLGTLRMMHQGIFPSSLTSLPQKNTMKMMTIPQEPSQGGSYLPWWEVGPPLPQSVIRSPNCTVTMGVLPQKSTTAGPWIGSCTSCPLTL